jgi:hypothetical protein
MKTSKFSLSTAAVKGRLPLVKCSYIRSCQFARAIVPAPPKNLPWYISHRADALLPYLGDAR